MLPPDDSWIQTICTLYPMYSYSQFREIFKGKTKPFAWIDLDALRNNLRVIEKQAGNMPIRIATKSIRNEDILRVLLKEGKQFCGLMTWSPEETLTLSKNGFDQLLLGYPIHDSQHYLPLLQEIAKGKKITFMVDAESQLRQLNQLAATEKTTVSICIDLDMSSDFPGVHFGVYRSPVNSVEAALKLWHIIQELPFLQLRGVMGYEAQIAGIGDNVPGQGLKNILIRFLKKRSVKEINQRREKIVKALKADGAELEFVNGGGTGSIHETKTDSSVTEITVGSGFFAPTLFDNYSSLNLTPAAGFAIEIVRKPASHIYTCLGGGYIASGSAGPEKLPSVYLPKRGKLLKNEGAGEVQTPVVYSGNEKLEIGDPVFFRHAKAGEMMGWFKDVWMVEGGKIL